MSFDMANFLKDFQEALHPSGIDLVLGTIHHLWVDHPLKVELSIGLVRITDDLVLDFADIQYIRREPATKDYVIGFKSGDAAVYVYEDTPEYDALLVAIAALGKRSHEEH